jgi:hypothetical protein
MSGISLSVKNSALSISGVPDGFLKSNSAAISATATIDTANLSNSLKNRIDTIEDNIETLQTTNAIPELADGFVKSVSGNLTSGNISISDITNLQTTLDTLSSNSGSSGITEADATIIATNIATNIATTVATNIATPPPKT